MLVSLRETLVGGGCQIHPPARPLRHPHLRGAPTSQSKEKLASSTDREREWQRKSTVAAALTRGGASRGGR